MTTFSGITIGGPGLRGARTGRPAFTSVADGPVGRPGTSGTGVRGRPVRAVPGRDPDREKDHICGSVTNWPQRRPVRRSWYGRRCRPSARVSTSWRSATTSTRGSTTRGIRRSPGRCWARSRRGPNASDWRPGPPVRPCVTTRGRRPVGNASAALRGPLRPRRRVRLTPQRACRRPRLPRGRPHPPCTAARGPGHHPAAVERRLPQLRGQASARRGRADLRPARRAAADRGGRERAGVRADRRRGG